MRLAHQTPVKCSGCFGQKPTNPHVDFESALDGPLIDPDNPRSGHIDWVVLCDDCVRAGYELLPERLTVVEKLRAEVAQLRQRAEESENYASKIEDALQHRPEARKRERQAA